LNLPSQHPYKTCELRLQRSGKGGKKGKSQAPKPQVNSQRKGSSPQHPRERQDRQSHSASPTQGGGSPKQDRQAATSSGGQNRPGSPANRSGGRH
jgi:hypothetical protein